MGIRCSERQKCQYLNNVNFTQVRILSDIELDGRNGKVEGGDCS